MTEFFSPPDLVLGRLGVRRSVEHCLILDLAGRLVGLLDDAADRRAFGAAGMLAELLESAFSRSTGLLVTSWWRLFANPS